MLIVPALAVPVLLIVVLIIGAFHNTLPNVDDLAERCSKATNTLNRRVDGPVGCNAINNLALVSTPSPCR